MKARAKCMPWLQNIISESLFDEVHINSCCFHGAPQVLKLARNHLVDKGFILNPSSPKPEQEVANVEPLLLEIIPGKDVPLQKVTHQHHLTCEGCDRQIVRLATQELSQQMAVALERGWKEKVDESGVSGNYNFSYQNLLTIINTLKGNQQILRNDEFHF